MRKLIPIAVLLIPGIVGCDIQRGHFITTGDRATAISPQLGLIDIVEGYPNDNNAVSEDLVYLLVVCPEIHAHGNGSGINMGKYLTSLNYYWNAETGNTSIQVQWNRETDVVSMGEKKFDRAKGDVFVVKRLPSGEVECRQISSLGKHADFSEVLKHVQQEMSGDKLITSLKLYKN